MVLAAAVVVLAAVVLFVALRAASGDAEDEVVAGPASRQEARQDKRRTQRRTSRTRTSGRAGKGNRKEPNAPASPALSAAKRGPTAVLSGVPQPGAAAKVARRLKRRGFRTGTVTNAPGPAARSAVLYAKGARAAGLALAEQLGIRTVRPVDRTTVGAVSGAKLYVVVGARN